MKKKVRKRKSTVGQIKPLTHLSLEEEEKKIIEMLEARTSQAEIAHRFKRNINYINAINKKRLQSLRPRDKSIASEAFKLFKEGKTALDVAIDLGIEGHDAEEYLSQYWRLRNLDDLCTLYGSVGSKLGVFLGAFNHLTSKGITIDQAIEMRNLTSNAVELRMQISNLKIEKTKLSADVVQLNALVNSLNSQLENLNSQINQKRPILEQLRKNTNDLVSMLNSIDQGNISLQQIKRMAIESVKSIVDSRAELILMSFDAVVKTIKDNHNLLPLLLAPGPGLDDPRLRKQALELANKLWDQLLTSTAERAMNNVFENLKQIVIDLSMPRSLKHEGRLRPK